jgi:hypothetical protein
MLNKSVRAIKRYLGELISKGLIIKRRRGSISNEYELVEKANKNTSLDIKKAPSLYLMLSESGDDLLFHRASPAVPSAL